MRIVILLFTLLIQSVGRTDSGAIRTTMVGGAEHGGESVANDGWPASPTDVLPLFEAISFWLAIFMPLFYLPLLWTGLDAPVKQFRFLALITVNALAIVVGHSYRR
jgi:hypothetical protein